MKVYAYIEAGYSFGTGNSETENSIALTNDGHFFISSLTMGGYYYIRFIKFHYGGSIISETSYTCPSQHVYSYAISKTNDGGAIVVGSRPMDCTGSMVAFAVKFDSGLAIAWQLDIPTATELYGIDYIGDFLLTGYGSGAWGTAIIAYDGGSYGSTYTANSAGLSSYFYAGILVNSNYYITGYMSTSLLSDQCCLAILNSGFGQISILNFGGGNIERCSGIKSDSSNNLYLAGYTNSMGAGSNDGYLVKTDSNGNLIWQKTYGGTGNDIFKKIVPLLDSTFVLFGTTNSGLTSIDFWNMNVDINGNEISRMYYSSSIRDETAVSLIFVENRMIAYSGVNLYSSIDADIFWRAYIWRCPAGTYLSGSTHCIKCPVGQYQNQIDQTTCIDCDPGKYADTIGSTACTDCPVGQFCPTYGTISPIPCDPGTYANNLNTVTCSQCDSGYVQPLSGKTSCIACTPGHYQDGSYFIQCKNCLAGTYQPDSAKNFCYSAPQGGYVDHDEAINYSICSPGNVQPLGGQTSCNQCDYGYFQSNSGQLICNKCSAGSFANSKGTIFCSQCSPGYFQDLEGQTQCKKCSAGSKQAGNGAISCDSCLPGFYQNQEAQTVCLPCAAGYYAANGGTVNCDPCDPGWYQDLQYQTQCKKCSLGTVQPLPHKIDCDICPPGYYQDQEAQTVCKKCSAGSKQSGSGASTCDSCLPGYYQNQEAQTSCLPCAAGYYALNGGTTLCTPCDPGWYQDLEHQTQCKKCSLGTVQPLPHKIDCDICPPGYYQDQEAQTVCKKCSAGSKQSGNGASSCDQCLPGYYQDQEAQPACLPCAAGYFASAGSAKICDPCDPGWYQDLEHQTQCKKCSAGTVQPLSYQAGCDICPVGSFQDLEAQTDCKLCPEGQYQDESGKLNCKDCPLGKFQAFQGKDYCDPCNPGEYTDTLASKICKKCSVGYYQEFSAKDSCNQCPIGYVQPLEGQPSCDICPIGTHQDELGKTICKDCQPGYFQNSPGQEFCNKCPAGQYQTDSAKDYCINCNPGSYQNLEGQANCVLCEPGKYQPDPGSSTCKLCDVMTYQDESGKISCKNCDPGFYQDVIGQAKCLNCLTQCKLCTSKITCTECFTPYSLYTDVSPPECLDPCPVHHFSESGLCKDCVSFCAKCTTNTNCLACDPGYFVDNSDPLISKCVKTCPIRYFANYETGFCEVCIDNCRDCVNSRKCIRCMMPYARKTNYNDDTDTCVTDCGLKYYAFDQVCIPCDFRCQSCTGSSNYECPNCDTSVTGVIRKGPNTCVCGDGYTADIDQGKCVRCEDPLCMECNMPNRNECLRCDPSYTGIIYSPAKKACVCVAGSYRDGEICLPCHFLCSECDGPTNRDCLPKKCADKAYALDYQQTTCLYMCRTPMDDLYIDFTERVCKPCVSPCRSCFDGNSVSCLTCKNNWILLGNACVTKCPDKYYVDSGVCMPCDPKCKACVNRVNYCIDGCEQHFLYKDHSCLTDCGEGFAGHNGYCELCDIGCTSCKYIGNDKICFHCEQNKFLLDNKCLSECPPGRYANTETGTCDLCGEACSECFGNSYRECYKCNINLGYIMVSENICMFPTCTDGFYYNKTARACKECPKECTTCTSSTNCTNCQKGYLLDNENKRCLEMCTKLGFTKKKNTVDECTEICGDGRNMGILECDDGNSKDNDGCSSDCKVEEYYECSGGNTENADMCINRKPLKIASFKYYGNRTAVLIFENRCTLQKIDSAKKQTARLQDIMMFFVDTENGLKSVDWSYNEFNAYNFKSITFQVNLNFSLSGRENIILKFIKPQLIMDMNGNELNKDFVTASAYKFKYISDSDKSSADGAGSVSLYAMLPGVGLNLGLSLIFNTPIEGMWATVSVLQMTSYVTLMNLNFPQNLLAFLDCVESVHDFNRWFPNPFVYMFPPSRMNMSAYNDQFNSRGFTNRNMLYLCGSDIATMAITGLLILILIPLSNSFPFFNKILDKLRYSSIARSFIQSYLKISIAAAVNVGIYSFKNPATSISSLISILMSCMLVGVPAFISEFLYLHREEASGDKQFKIVHSSYISGFRVKANIMNLMYYPIYIFRRLAFATTIVILYDYPVVQLVFVNIGTFGFIIYIIYWKPFKNKFSLYCAVSSELFFVIFTLMLFTFIAPQSDYINMVMGWVMISTVITSMLASWVFVALQQIRHWKFITNLRAQQEIEKNNASNNDDIKTNNDDRPEVSKENIDEKTYESQENIINNKPEEHTITLSNEIKAIPPNIHHVKRQFLPDKVKELQEAIKNIIKDKPGHKSENTSHEIPKEKTQNMAVNRIADRLRGKGGP